MGTALLRLYYNYFPETHRVLSPIITLRQLKFSSSASLHNFNVSKHITKVIAMPIQHVVHSVHALTQVEELPHGLTLMTFRMGGSDRVGFYVEIKQFPDESTPGRAIYIDARGTEDTIYFICNAVTDTLVAWHAKSPSNIFTMTPVLEGQRAVGLSIQFSNLPTFFALFALNLSVDEEDAASLHEAPATAVHIAELSDADF